MRSCPRTRDDPWLGLKDCPEHHRRESQGNDPRRRPDAWSAIRSTICRRTGGGACHKRKLTRTPKRNATDPQLLSGQSPVLGLRVRLLPILDKEPGQVNARRLNRGASICRTARRCFHCPRHLGEENVPKTGASRRTITLLPNVVELLQCILPLRVEPHSYVFTDGQGKPIDQSEFNRCRFQPVL